MPRHRRFLRLCAPLAPILLAAPAAHAVHWNVPTGDFTLDTNWLEGVAPFDLEPADIDNGGTAIIKSGDSAVAAELHVGGAAGTTGNLTMNGGTLRITIALGNGDDNAVAIGEFGRGTFTMNDGLFQLGSLTGADADFHIGKSNNANSTMTMNGGTVRMGGTLRIARGQAAPATATLNLLGGEFDTGTGVVVARGNAGNRAEGTFVIGGTGKFIAGNSLGEGQAGGYFEEGFFSIANSVNTVGHVNVKDNGVVKAYRLTARQGGGDLIIEGNGKFFVVNNLGVPASGQNGLYNSFLGGGSVSNGDGNNGDTGNYTLILRGSGLLDIDANAFNRGADRPELQGFVLARGNSAATATVQGNASLIVRQRLVIGGLGERAKFDGKDGLPEPGTNPGGGARLTVSGGTVSTDHLIVGGSGIGRLDVTGGVVSTQAYASTYDATDTVSEPGKSSVNAIRIGMFTGSIGNMHVSGGAVSTGGDLSIGQYGDGTLKVTGAAASIQARDVYVQKFAGSTGRITAEISGPTHTPIRASNDVILNGGTLEVMPANPPATGARKWVILRADSDNDNSGQLSGAFGNRVLPPDDSAGRRWSAFPSGKEYIVGLTIPGDSNFDATVNFTDLVALAQNYNTSDGTAIWPTGDFTGDGNVDFTDLVSLAQNYNKTLAASPIPGAASGFNDDLARAFAQVPEPTALALLALAFPALYRRRRA